MVVSIAYIFCQAIYIKKMRFDLNLLFLSEPFFIRAMIQMHTGRSGDVPKTLAMPLLAYFFGKMLVAERNEESSECKSVISTAALGLGLTLAGFISYRSTISSQFADTGYYFFPFNADAFYLNELMFYFNFSFAICFLGAICVALLWKMLGKNNMTSKVRSYIFACLGTLFLLIMAIWYVKNIRFAAFKEGIRCLFTEYWGIFTTTVMYDYSTSNMWLDFEKNFGIMVFLPLFIFLLLTIKDTVKLTINRNVGIFSKTLLVLLYVVLNLYYFTEPSASVYPYLWYIGLIVNGIISQISNKS